MKRRIKAAVLAAALMVFVAGIFSGCRLVEREKGIADAEPGTVPLKASHTFAIPVPTASGTLTAQNDKAIIDYSNLREGYVMVRYLKNTAKRLKVLIDGPSGAQYTYTLRPGDYEVFPLSDGDGSYTIGVYEQVEGKKYATVVTASAGVALVDEFAPFIRPNQYVNYNKDSDVVEKAAELMKGADRLIDRISAVYNYVINDISYDKELAQTVQSGYIPDVDAVLERKKGICFDYAAVMTAMLRSHGIPTKLIFGYTGDAYHAWISVYSEETGWIDNIIYFDGMSWELMDPTFASSGRRSDELMKYIGDGSNYMAKYQY